MRLMGWRCSSHLTKKVNLTVLREEKLGDHQSLQALSSKHPKCLYKVLQQSIQ